MPLIKSINKSNLQKLSKDQLIAILLGKSVPAPLSIISGSYLRSMNVTSLKRLAKGRELKGYSKMRRDEQVNLFKPIPVPRIING